MSFQAEAGYRAESAPEVDGRITFHILNHEPFSGCILKKKAPSLFALEYLGTVVDRPTGKALRRIS